MSRNTPLTLALMIALLYPIAGQAQATAPATAPATTRPRQQVVIPPGFNVVTVGHHNVILEPVDAPWVRQTLEAIKPTTLPTTMPSNLLERLATEQEALKAQITKDLAFAEATVVEKFLKETLEPQLQRYDEIQPPLYYMVTTRPRLVALVKGGWSDPRFHYNRVADDVQMSRAVNLNTDGPADDVLVPVIYDAEEALDKKQERLVRTIHTIESDLAQQISMRAQIETQLAFIAFIAREVFNPLKLKNDQEWFTIGVAGALSARYASRLTGLELDQLIRGMTVDRRDNPIRSITIDLIHPTPLGDMRPQAIPAYADAFQRKSSRVVLSWMDRAGEGAVAKVITALRQSVPPDGPGLLALIQQQTGVDLTADVKAGS